MWATVSGVFGTPDGRVICYHPMGKEGMCWLFVDSFRKEWRLLPPTRYEWLSNGPALL